MADDGIRMSNLPEIPRVDYLDGNGTVGGNNRSGKVSVDVLAQQLATSGPLSSVLAMGAFVPHSRKTFLDNDLDHPADTIAWVVGDGNNDAIYRKVGASGSGSWKRFAALPYVAAVAGQPEVLYTEIDSAAANGTHSRPGDPGDYFSADYNGAPDDLAPWAETDKQNSFRGAVAVLSGSSWLAKRVPVRIEPNRSYRARFVIRRDVDVGDPANDAVRFGVKWLDGHYQVISTMVFEDVTTLTTGDGRVQKVYNFPSDDFPRPSSAAVYARPFARTFGADGVTHVEIIEIADMTDATAWSPNLDAIEAEIATLSQQVDDVNDLVGLDPLFTGDLNGLTIPNTGAADSAIAAMRAPIFGQRPRPMLGNYPIVLGGAIVKQDVLDNGDEGFDSLADSGDESQSWIGWTSLTWTLPGVGDAGTPKWLIPFKAQDIPVDIRDGMIVLHLKEIQNVWNAPTGQIDRLIIRLYSEGWPDPANPSIDDLPGDYLEIPAVYPDFYAGHVTNGVGAGWWHKYMVPANQFAVVGAGADPTAIRFAALGFRAAAGATVKLATGLVQFVPNALDRAKVVFRVDDGKKGHYTDMAADFSRFGFPLEHHPGAVGTTIRDDDTSFESTYMIKQMHDLHGHQIGAQTWDSELLDRIEEMNDGQRTAYMAKALAWNASQGVTGGETGTYHTEIAYQVSLAREMFRTHFAEVLMFGGGYSLPAPAPFSLGEMYPWGDPMAVRCLSIENDDWDTPEKIFERIQAHVLQAEANRGVALLALHDYFRLDDAVQAMFRDMVLPWLDARRDKVDVCTIQDIKSYPRADLGGRTVPSLMSRPVKTARLVPLNARVVVIGDDVAADAWDDPADTFGSYKSVGFLAYALSGLGARLYLPPGGNLGAYTQTVAQTADDANLDAVIAYRPKLAILAAGARSPYEPVYETEDHFRHIYKRLNDAGIVVAHLTPLPDNTLDDTGEAHRQILRRFILSRRSPMVIPVDLETVLDWSTTGMRSNLLPDAVGSLAIGEACGAAIDTALEPADLLSRIAFEHTDNAEFKGGSTTATGWTLDTSGAGGATVAASKHAEPGGNVAQRITISGTYTGNDKQVVVKQDQTTNLPAVGDIVEGIIELEVIGDMTAIISVSVAIRLTNTDFSFRGYCDSMGGSTGLMLSSGFDGARRRFRTPAFVIPDQAGKTLGTITTEVTIRFTNAATSSAVAAVIDVWRAGIRDVPAGS